MRFALLLINDEVKSAAILIRARREVKLKYDIRAAGARLTRRRGSASSLKIRFQSIRSQVHLA
jgi:hypothetical protein